MATLVIPALTACHTANRRYPKTYAVRLMDYAAGLMLRAATDLPSGVMIVRALAVTGAIGS